MRTMETPARWRSVVFGCGILAAGMALGAVGAGIGEADQLWRGGQREAAVAKYQEVAASYGARDDLTTEERLEYAGALTNLALAQVQSLSGAEAGERRVKAMTAQLTSAAGARMLPEISHGQTIEVKDVIAADKPTLIYFGSPYCPPCMEHLPLIERMAAGQTGFHVIWANVNRPEIEGIDWESPIAKQFGLENLPTLKFYNPDGTVLVEGDAAIEKINEALKKMQP